MRSGGLTLPCRRLIAAFGGVAKRVTKGITADFGGLRRVEQRV
jgi:hypothetical protein